MANIQGCDDQVSYKDFKINESLMKANIASIKASETSILSLKQEFSIGTKTISELISEGKLKITGNLNGKKMTYHDPCYLGRANGVYDSPRSLIRSLGVDVVEMKRSKSRSFCCGAGGAQMFKDAERGDKEINIDRTEEALALKPDIIATGCPFCNTMMTDGVKAVNEGAAEVLDIAELIAENI